MKRLALTCVAAVAYLAASQNAPGQVKFFRTVGDVKLIPAGGASVPGRPGLAVADRSVVVTGAGSRAEVRSARGSILRPGATTTLGIQGGGQFIDLRTGVVLLSVPPGAPALQVATGSVVTSLGNGTMIFEHQPRQFVKAMVLDGRPKIMMRAMPGQASTLRPGHMVIAPPQGPLAPAVDFDIEVVLRSSLLLKNFAPLPTRNSIFQQVGMQKRQRQGGGLVDTNLVIYGSGTAVTLTTPPPRKSGARKRSVKASPTPSRAL